MGALRRAAPVPAAARSSRGAAPTARRAMAQGSSSSVCRAGANKKPSAPGSSYVKVVRNGVALEMEVIAVGVSEMLPNVRPISKRPRDGSPPPAAGGAVARRESSTRRIGAGQKLPAPSPKHAKVTRSFMKRPHQIVESAACGASAMAGEKSARRTGADEEVLMPSQKRGKVTPSGVEAFVDGDVALGTLRKRMAEELDAVHALLRKAELLSSSKKARFVAAAGPRSEAPAEASVKTPPAKQRKVPALATIVKFQSTKVEHEYINICGGVSPVAIPKSSPVIAIEKAGETDGNSESRETPEDGNKIVDVPVVVSVEKAGESSHSPSSSRDSGSSSSSDSDSGSDSGSSSSSDSDSDSDAESDADEKNGASLQPAPASKVGQSTEPEKIAKAALIAKANLRRTLLEMETAALPDESILPRDLKDLCIVEYGRASIMQKLGLFLKADA